MWIAGLWARVGRKEMYREMSKNDYNFSVLLVLLVVILGITGIAALGALMMFMTAFM
jgi:quinol-cytochrome oxidoreductase complex cytochrome b subunit